ncbi:tail fiber protein [Prochlorococcus phage P-TIM68]|uniref:Putative tail fiber-like protein n=1 Tax=Prochlorococcus phage P-TIM68 TaxID=1542477 RepID=A0A0K0KVG5_9CAUD|nr:tail fiber protein [Prochlorococcus phage P-TIM68]AIR93436.1 putative tail fiber-like protein [Prochlorococcus phage P-TIM68]
MTKHKSESLADFFNSIGGEKKKLKEEKKKIIGDLSLDNLFSSMEKESRKIQEEKKQLKKDVEAFKNLLFKEEKKEDKPVVKEEPTIEEEPIVEEEKEETVVEHAVKILDVISEEVETVETEPDLAKLKKEIEVLKQVVYEQGGGGEVRLEFLDDVDRDTALVDGRFLKYESSTKKFIGAVRDDDWVVDSVGIHTTRNIGIGTTAKSNFALDVTGNARITGILTIGTNTITLDPSSDIIQVGVGITIDANQEKIIVGDSEVADATGNSKFAGIVTAKSFSGFTHLSAPYSTTTTIMVKVASKISGQHRYHGQGSGLGYVLDNIQAPFLTLTPGKTYRFDVSDSSNSGHPFRFYYDAAKNTQYTSGVTIGSGYVDLEVTDTTPTVLHYQCSAHGFMGNAVQINSNALDITSNAKIVGVLTATSFVGGLTGDVTGDLTGDVTGNVTGNLTGNVNGNVTGNVTGNLTGNVNASGVSTFTDNIQLKSSDGSPGRIDFYCESNNAHYVRLKAPPHSEFSGNPSVVLPVKAGDLIVGDTSGAITQTINTSGSITASSFVGNLTGNITGNAEGTSAGLSGTPSISVVDITSRHINSSGVVTATSFVGDGSQLTGVSGGSAAGISTTGTSVFNNINASGVVTATTFVGNLTGNPTGTIQTAAQPNITSLGTLSSLNVSGNVSIGGTLTYEDVTSIDSVGLITARSGIVVSGVSTFLGSQKGINAVGVSSFAGAINANGGVTGDLTGNADTATKLATARTIGGVSFDGSAAINLPGVNASGNQDTSGNAATATALETARTIGGVSFDGTSNINLPGVNTSGNQDTSGNAATATVSVNAQGLTGTPNVQVGNITVTGDLTVQGTTNSETSTDTTVTGILTARSINVGTTAAGIGVTFDQGGGVFSGIVTSHTVRASKALYLPLYTTTTRDAGSFTQGAVIFNTTVKKLEFFDGDNWNSIPEVTTGLVLALDS